MAVLRETLYVQTASSSACLTFPQQTYEQQQTIQDKIVKARVNSVFIRSDITNYLVVQLGPTITNHNRRERISGEAEQRFEAGEQGWQDNGLETVERGEIGLANAK